MKRKINDVAHIIRLQIAKILTNPEPRSLKTFSWNNGVRGAPSPPASISWSLKFPIVFGRNSVQSNHVMRITDNVETLFLSNIDNNIVKEIIIK